MESKKTKNKINNKNKSEFMDIENRLVLPEAEVRVKWVKGVKGNKCPATK